MQHARALGLEQQTGMEPLLMLFIPPGLLLLKPVNVPAVKIGKVNQFLCSRKPEAFLFVVKEKN